MELYHHLIDTDQLGARIAAAAERRMPQGLEPEEQERTLEAVDEAVEPLLKNDLKQLMDRVEAVIHRTVGTAPEEAAQPAGKLNLQEDTED